MAIKTANDISTPKLPQIVRSTKYSLYSARCPYSQHINRGSMALMGRDRSGATSSTGGNEIGVHCHLEGTHQNNVCFHIPGIHRPNVNQWIKYGASFWSIPTMSSLVTQLSLGVRCHILICSTNNGSQCMITLASCMSQWQTSLENCDIQEHFRSLPPGLNSWKKLTKSLSLESFKNLELST